METFYTWIFQGYVVTWATVIANIPNLMMGTLTLTVIAVLLTYRKDSGDEF